MRVGGSGWALDPLSESLRVCGLGWALGPRCAGLSPRVCGLGWALGLRAACSPPRARAARSPPHARAHARTARASPPQPAAIRNRHRVGEVGAWGGDRSIERLPASLWMWTGLGRRVLLPCRWMPTGLGPRSFSIEVNVCIGECYTMVMPHAYFCNRVGCRKNVQSNSSSKMAKAHRRRFNIKLYVLVVAPKCKKSALE